MTEASPLTHHSPLEPELIKLASGGTPVSDTEQQVVDLETGDQTLGPGEVSEIRIRGPQIMRGYWQAEAESARVLRNGWYSTGDVGYRDEQGYNFIVDRAKVRAPQSTAFAPGVASGSGPGAAGSTCS